MKKTSICVGLALTLVVPGVSLGGHLSREVIKELKHMRSEALQEIHLCQTSAEFAREQQAKRDRHCDAIEGLLSFSSHMSKPVLDSVEAEWERDCNSPQTFHNWLQEKLEGCKKSTAINEEKIKFIDEILGGR